MIIEKVERLCGDMDSDHVSHDWGRSFTDPGGTIWGPGPYLKLIFAWPDGVQGWERIHCPYGYPEDGEGVKSVECRREGDLWIWIIETE